MSSKKLWIVGIMAVSVCVCLAATPTVTDVTAKQRYPWNGLVDITCKMMGIQGTTEKFVVSAVMPGTGNTNELSNLWIVRNGTKSTDLDINTNGNYHLLWDARADLGQVNYDNMVVRVTTVKGHAKVQLWEGGPYWAETNIGAEKPEDYGYYFWWGDTVGYKREDDKWVATDGSSQNFSFGESNTPTYNKGVATLQSEGWITADNVLAPEHDAAHVHWGGNWRMPTEQELDDLNSKCDWTWTTTNGVNGYIVCGKGAYASSSIFLPIGGCGRMSKISFSYGGFYWSSVPSRGLYFFDSSSHYTGTGGRDDGHSVRPVRGFTE